MMTKFDVNGEELFVRALVYVPEPTPEDQWNFEFAGTIVKIDEEGGYAIVEDGDGDCWCVENERLELQQETKKPL